MLPGILLRKPHRDQALPPPHQVHVEKWPDIKSYSRLLLAKVREGRARNPTETLKETVTCGLQEKQSLVGRGFSAADSNTAFPSFPFCWWEEEIPPAHSGTGRKRKEVAQGKSLTQNHKPAISTPGGRHGGGETVLPGSKLAQRPSWCKQRASLLPQAPPHTFGERVNTAPGFAAMWTRLLSSMSLPEPS